MKSKGIIFLCAMMLFSVVLSGCTQKQKQSSLESENSSLKAENKKLSSSSVSTSSKEESSQESMVSSSSISESNQPTSTDPIQTAQDAADLITHSMHVNPGIYHAVPVSGGFMVSRDDESGAAFVRYNGNITWTDGETTSYSQDIKPTINY